MNHLCVSTCEAIKALALKGWSGRRIARELAVNRETVARYLGPSKPASPTPGSHFGRRSLCEVHLAEITLAIVSGRIKPKQTTVSRFVSIRHPTEGGGIFQKVVARPVNIGYFDSFLWISLADSDPRLQCVFPRENEGFLGSKGRIFNGFLNRGGCPPTLWSSSDHCTGQRILPTEPSS